jgi:hypothetical protein
VASKRELEALIVLSGKVDPSLQKALKKAQGDTTKTSSSMQKLSVATNKFMGNIVKSAVTVGAGLVAALGIVGNKGIELASDLTEVQNVVESTFIQSAKQIDKWADTALESFGLSKLQAKQFTGTMGAMLKSSKITGQALITMSEDLSGLAGDFASFYNLDTEEAFNKIRAGISGETEPLKQLGINMSVANLEAFAMSKGIKTSYQKMDQASQSALRYAYLMEVSKDAQGDFAKTLDTSYANQKRLFSTNFNQKLAEIAAKALPKLTEGFKTVNDIMTRISTDKAADIVALGVTNIANKLNDLVDLTVKLYNFTSSNWSTIEPIIWGIVGAIGAWKIATIGIATYKGIMTGYKAATEAASWAQKTLTIAKLKDGAATLYLKGLYAKDVIVKGASTFATWAMTAATSAWTIATTIATAVGGAFAAVIAFITSPIGLVILAIGALIAIGVLLYRNWDTVSAKAQALWVQVKSVFSGIGEAIGGAFKFGMNIAIGAINKIIRAVNSLSIKVPDWVPAIGGKKVGFKLPELPMFANGGFTNVPSIFGEAGLEAAIPIKYNSPRSIGLLNQTAKAIGADSMSDRASASFTFAPTIYGGNIGEIKKMLEDEMEKFKVMAEAWHQEKERVTFG